MLGYHYPTTPFEPFWGFPTATIDWCEENYLFSPYIAELVNSTTNFGFILLACHHIYSTIKNKHGLLYIFISIGFASVGIGSFMFHSTLWYEHQMMDELPMVWVTAIPFGYIYGWGKTEPYHTLWNVGNFISTCIFTYVYIFIFRDPSFHQVYYGLLNFLLIYKTYKVTQEVIIDKNARIKQYKLLTLAFSLFIFGFLIWNLDNAFCKTIIGWRREYLGWPLGFLLEGHGWWHLFTGLGIYYFIVYNMILSTYMKGKNDEYEVVRYYGILVEVRLKKSKND
ncbi:alkaline dihydroceramidase [Martiniozyma asiatica (nom. inval.)]|nr:alkaline dihydroceramidase [Martiniozyma asiatica]